MIHLRRRRQAVCAELVQNAAPRIFETDIHHLVSQWDKCLKARANTSDIWVLVSVPRPMACFFLNAPHTFRDLLDLQLLRNV